MKMLSLVLIVLFGGAASAGYNEAGAALKSQDPQVKELDALLARPAAALARDAQAAALLAENQRALDLFRQAAAESSDGYLFAPKPEKPGVNGPAPKFAPQLKLLRLLLLEAKV